MATGVAVGLTIVGGLMQASAAQKAAAAQERADNANAKEAAINARLAKERAINDEREFRLSFRKDNASNIVAIAGAGIRLQGSAIEALRDNAIVAETDALRIRKGGDDERNSYLRQRVSFERSARDSRSAGRAGASAALLGAGTSIARRA